MSLLDLIIVAVAGWRLAFFFVHERGPFALAEHVRALLQADKLDTAANEQSRLFACVWCLSLWTTAGLYALHFASWIPVDLVALWGGATMLDMSVRRD